MKEKGEPSARSPQTALAIQGRPLGFPSDGCSQMGVICQYQGIFWVVISGAATVIEWVEARDADTYPAVH
jgi:hypothetical protein